MSEHLDKTSHLIREAVKWAESGVPVFPCNSNKAPLTSNGFYDAETDPSKVKALFQFYGDQVKMIGGRMGDGIFAVDVDLYKGPEVKEWMEEKIRDGTLTETRTHKTARGGIHFLYQGNAGCTDPVTGVEIKGDGGYIILPGTPGYSTIREGIAGASTALSELISASVSSTKGSSKSVLEGNILSGKDFHNSLTQLAAKMAFEGKEQIAIQSHLTALLNASTAARVGHARHSRWLNVVQDKGGELSRIAHSAYVKYNDEAVMDDLRESLDAFGEHAAVAEQVFSPTPNQVEGVPREFGDDEWPFEKGYWGHTEHDLEKQSFTMYPIFAENETVVLYAEPKTGKTAISLTTALSIACGIDLGSFKVASAGPTLYYALEGSRAIRLRVAAWRKKKKAEGVEIPDDIPLWVEEGHTSFLKEDRRKEEANKIIAANRYSIKKGMGPLKAVYLDTLTKAMSGGDQNSVDDTSSLFDLIGLLRAGGVTATVIFVHHKSRTGNARGSTNIEAEPDVLLDISKKGSVVEMRIARARSIEDGARFQFMLEGVDLGKTEQGHPLAGVYASPIDAPTEDDQHEAYAAAKELSDMRSTIVSMGKRVTSAQVMKAWLNKGIVKGKKARGTMLPPAWDSADGQALLKKVAPEAGVANYGNYLIRERVDAGKVVGFDIGEVSY